MRIADHWIRVPVTIARREEELRRKAAGLRLAALVVSDGLPPGEVAGYSPEQVEALGDWWAQSDEDRGEMPGPDLPLPEPSLWLLVEPPADMSTLPAEAREAMLATALSAGGAARSPTSASAAMVDAAMQAAASVTCATVRGLLRVVDGAEQVEAMQIKPVRQRAPGIMPLASIPTEERLAVMEAVRTHINSFRDLLR